MIPDSFDVLIVGAGPAGLMAAIAAARAGRRVGLCEQMPRAGMKLLSTGGGRCNLTNTAEPESFMAAFGRHGRFMEPALARLGSQGLRDFMAALGVPTIAPDGFHVYPASESAADVQHALLQESKRCGVVLLLDTKVDALRTENHTISGLETNHGFIGAHHVVLACGGRSYPKLGATGSGYALATQAGHTIMDPLPVLVPLDTREEWPGQCAGISLENVEAWIDAPRFRQAKLDGGLVFTHHGVSGPPILNLSRDVVPLLHRNGHVPIRISLFPGRTPTAWLELFAGWQHDQGRRTVARLLGELLPARLAETLTATAGADPAVCAAEFARPAREKLAELLSGCPLTITGAGDFDEAMVTRGGVSLREVDPHTLQSVITKGLFFAGEILDLDGPCGGYNLQWAFSSGWLAGSSPSA